MKSALITGISGQAGSYLCELLLEKGYTVTGIVRRNSVFLHESPRLDHITDSNLKLVYGDMTDTPSIVAALEISNPDEIYNLASQSDVRISFDIPTYTAQVCAMGAANLFESARNVCPNAKIYQASTSELYGNSVDDDGFQRETTPMVPVSPYGNSKLFAYNTAKIYRQSYGMFISNGILFNHESPRRGDNFVTNKVVDYAVRIKNGNASQLPLGNIHSIRDWGHAAEFVQAMWMMLQSDTPNDYVVATGVKHSVIDLVNYVFTKLDMNWQDYVLVDKEFMRPHDVDYLCGDSSKLQKELGWKPNYTFEQILDEMIEQRLGC